MSQTNSNVAVESQTPSNQFFAKTYHELLETTIVEQDALERLKSNIQSLEDLHGRLQFAMTEIRTLIKRA